MRVLLDRIEAKIVRHANGCWIWVGARTGSGYGQAWFGGRKMQAHRLTYEMMRGPIPDGMTLDHLCRVRLCVNPAHLEPVTRGENVLRGEGVTAKRARSVTCKYGHQLVADHRPGRAGWRWCPVCHKAVNARRPTTRAGRILAQGGRS